jgi:conjugal transfer pilus assembly protein TraW
MIKAAVIILGNTFPIAESSLIDFMMARMKQVDLKKAEEEVKTRVVNTVRNPKPIFTEAAICKKPRIWHIDPTVTLDRDVVDHKGKILVKKGTTYNPLEHRTLSTKLVFILGTNRKQVEWALSQTKAKIVLVNGSPLDLEEQRHTAFYFDQGGLLCSKLGIAAFPAIADQDNGQLRCEEVALS